MADITPFKTKSMEASAPMRVLHRFTKPGRLPEIRERTVTQFAAIEFLAYVDGSMLESQMFHGSRLAQYPAALAERIKQFEDDGWVEQVRPLHQEN